MTAYREILASEVDPESPLLTALAVAWVNNLLAHMEGDPSMPAALVAHHIKGEGQIFESSNTWNRPTGVHFIKVITVGGGAGASGSGNSGGSLMGGGSGAYSEIWIDVSAISSVTVTIGAGGNGGAGAGTTNTPGANGGTSTFGSLTSCVGGIGGNNGSNRGRGGDTPTLGKVKSGGGDGDFVGGASFFGGGARQPQNDGNGVDAKAFGAGGGIPNPSGAVRTGGDGRAGVIIIEEYT